MAVVGCGGWAQGWHLPNLQNRMDATVVALVDPSEQPGGTGCVPGLCESMPALAAKYGAKWYKSLDELLADKDALGLSGVLCAGPHASHHKLGRAVIEAGLHLLMEKPMTADVQEARELWSLARARPEQAFLLNNTANWQPGTVAAFEAVAAGQIGEIRHVNCVFAAPLGWLFEGSEHTAWSKPDGSMLGNGFGWGQFSHTFAWIFKVTGLTPKLVYAVATSSEATGADLFDAATITCTNGCTISASGVGSCPDKGFKVVGNWIFGTGGMLSYCGLAGSDNVNLEPEADDGERPAQRARSDGGPRLEIWKNDGTHERGPPVEFEHLDQGGTGPGSMDAWINACRGLEYFCGAGATEGLKAVCTIEAIYRSAKEGAPVPVAGCDVL